MSKKIFLTFLPIAAVFLALSLVEPAEAGGCRLTRRLVARRPVCVSNSFCAPVVQKVAQVKVVQQKQVIVEKKEILTPVAYPMPYAVAVPVASYNYYGGAQAVPQGSRAPSFNFNPQNSQSQSAQLELTDEVIDKIIARIEERLQDRQDRNAAPIDPGLSPPREPRAISILRRNCLSCHTQSAVKRAKGGVVLFDGQGNYAPSIDRSEILNVIASNYMPLGARTDESLRLSYEDKRTIREWAENRVR